MQFNQLVLKVLNYVLEKKIVLVMQFNQLVLKVQKPCNIIPCILQCSLTS